MSVNQIVRESFDDDERRVFDLLIENARNARTEAFVAQCNNDMDGFMKCWNECGAWKYLVEDAAQKRLTQMMSA